MLIYYTISTVIAIIFGIIMLKKNDSTYIIEIPISFYLFVSLVMMIPFARLFLICFLKDHFKDL